MNWVRRFWGQPNKRYRNFQIVYTALTLNFAIPAATYYLDRDQTAERARKIGSLFGRSNLPTEEDTHIWWILGSGNVATLAFMCALLQFNLRRYRPVLPALLVLKGLSSIGFLALFARTRHPFYLAVSALDGGTTVAMAYFANGAYREIEMSDEQLVPEPVEV